MRQIEVDVGQGKVASKCCTGLSFKKLVASGPFISIAHGLSAVGMMKVENLAIATEWYQCYLAGKFLHRGNEPNQWRPDTGWLGRVTLVEVWLVSL